MSRDIRIKKGLTINLKGAAKKRLIDSKRSKFYALRPEDFHGITPKLLHKVHSKIKAGEPIFFDKNNDTIKFVSPVSGEITAIIRGEKRRILEIRIKASSKQSFIKHGKLDVNKASAKKIIDKLLTSGCWPFVKQRPYDVIANPKRKPKGIFISGYASAPLAADYNFTLVGKETQLQTALKALSKLTDGQVHVSIGKKGKSPFEGLKHIVLHRVTGPHPSGNVGTQINKINPINKGDVVWTVNPQDLIVIGELMLTGKFNAERVVAKVGSSIPKPCYIKTLIGCEIRSLMTKKDLINFQDKRFISGNVLSGKQVEPNGFLDYYGNTLTVLLEGNDYEFLGWTSPAINKFSTTRALTFSWLMPSKKYNLTTNTNGEHRAFVVTGSYEKVFPFDIYPLQLLKACMYKDLDEMEALGIYEVAPEDFALTEFVCVSKQPHQKIIRNGLDLMLKEIG